MAELPARVAAPDVSFTAFVSWAGFDPADVALADTPGHEAYRPVLTRVRAALVDHLARRARERSAAPGRPGPAARPAPRPWPATDGRRTTASPAAPGRRTDPARATVATAYPGVSRRG
ncbi:hypothetical protein K7640_06885 [Micromonospora sp. PLK6-60]|uniref:hypothetical protein n=1 Tax=Micromonospora sp. PLK6-60 TaxID=2873383 RepID=UPI001CA70AFE|nr:hypothetical protein [Micromonospora sp. PLK6-60]MBY8871569.1 hypothetical protein [Micromonospora sp. PLK6-60]